MAELTNLKIEQPAIARNRAELDAEIEQMAREQNVQPFDFDAVFGMGAASWSDAEFAQFERWLREEARQPEKESNE